MSDYLLVFSSPRWRSSAHAVPQRIAWDRQAALITFLASQPGWHARTSIAEMFRPDANAKDAAAYVRRLLHRLRAQYPDLNSLAEHAGMLQWTGGSDVADFRAAVPGPAPHGRPVCGMS